MLSQVRVEYSSFQHFLIRLVNNAFKFGLENVKLSIFSLEVSAPKASPMQETFAHKNLSSKTTCLYQQFPHRSTSNNFYSSQESLLHVHHKLYR